MMSNESLDPEAVDAFSGSEAMMSIAETLRQALEREKRFTFEELRQCLSDTGEVLGDHDPRREVHAVGLAHFHAGEHAINLFMNAAGNPEVLGVAETYWDRFETFQTSTLRCLLNILMLAGGRIRFYLEQPTADLLRDGRFQRTVAEFDRRMQQGEAGARRLLKENLHSGERAKINATFNICDGSLRLAAHCIANGYPHLIHSARPPGVASVMPELHRRLDELARRRNEVTDSELDAYAREYATTMDANWKERHAFVARSVASNGDHTPVMVFGCSHFKTQPPFSANAQCTCPLEESFPDRPMAVVMPTGGQDLATLGTEINPRTMSPDELRELLYKN